MPRAPSPSYYETQRAAWDFLLDGQTAATFAPPVLESLVVGRPAAPA
ncbi:hypothetical protein [Angustibacter luteus]|uniref:SAM-dependent methyltransferase n=1 Tax=Angustibacter luteus TaxID=658456 RepID=A0ABW1JB28_9ACTN